MSYAFLSHPPADNLLATSSTKTTSSRQRSATISSWAAQIVPGSPAPPTPRTPRTPSSFSFLSSSPRTPPGFPFGAPRRSSASAPSPRSPAENFLNLLDTPSTKDHHHVYDAYSDIYGIGNNNNTKPAAAVGLDFLAQGYTTVIVQLPSLASPLSPSLRSAPASRGTHNVNVNVNAPPQPQLNLGIKTKKSFTRLRSLSFKSSSKSVGTKVSTMAPASSDSNKVKSQSKSKPKAKAKGKSSTPHTRYAHLLAPGGGAGALPLAQEVQLAQMLDGGSLDVNVRRVAERHARDTGAVSAHSSAHASAARKDRRPVEKRLAAGAGGVGGGGVVLGAGGKGGEREVLGGGVSGVYRDARGGMWWDEDEQLELVELLPSPTSPSSPSVSSPTATSAHAQKKSLGLGLLPRFMNIKSGSQADAKETRAHGHPGWVDTTTGSDSPNGDAEAIRRGSATSSTSRDSAHDAAPVRPRDIGMGTFVAGYTLEMASSSFAGRRVGSGKAGAKQQYVPPSVLDAFGVSPLDTSAPSSSTSCSTSSTPTPTAENASTSARPRPRARHRPAPLTLPTSVSGSVSGGFSAVPAVAVPPTASVSKITKATAAAAAPTVPRASDEGKRDFFASSFAPSPAPASAHPNLSSNYNPPALASPSVTSSTDSGNRVKSAARRGSLSFGIGFGGFSTFANSNSSTTNANGRRASVVPASASPASASRSFVPGPSGNANASASVVYLPSEKEKVRTLKHKASSRSKLAGLFARNRTS